ncbi:hypothetical protein LZC95_19325 [Pendulispora brunnea]|uniref:Uncharacterized protein n=1 Tax=Pendulispora brunnea TaxID=2905690 RepID=A0ABZ2KPG6_9BACT
MSYEEKFADLIKLCQNATRDGANLVLLPEPEILGDTYEELVESLNRIADADLKVSIVPRRQRASINLTIN